MIYTGHETKVFTCATSVEKLQMLMPKYMFVLAFWTLKFTEAVDIAAAVVCVVYFVLSIAFFQGNPGLTDRL